MNLTLVGALRRPEALRLRSEFYRSWEVALRATQNAADSLVTMIPPDAPALEEARAYLVEGLSKGRPAGVVVKLRPDLFPVLDQLLIGAGEQFGTLHDSLRLLGEFYMREHARIARVRGWSGPAIVLGVVASFAVPYPLLWDEGSWAYTGAILTGIVALYGLGGVPLSLLYSLAERLDVLRRPRFAWTLAMGLEGGLTFAGAARLAATVSGNDAVGRHLDAIPPKTLKTMSLTQMLDGSGVWPAMFAQVKASDEMSEYLSSLRVFAEHLESPP